MRPNKYVEIWYKPKFIDGSEGEEISDTTMIYNDTESEKDDLKLTLELLELDGGVVTKISVEDLHNVSIYLEVTKVEQESKIYYLWTVGYKGYNFDHDERKLICSAGCDQTDDIKKVILRCDQEVRKLEELEQSCRYFNV